MKCAVKHAKKLQNADTSGKELLYFLDAGTATYLRETYGYGRKTLVRFLHEAYDGLIEDMTHYSADDENERDQMGNVFYGVTNRLKYDKIRPEVWERELSDAHRYTVHYAKGLGRTTGDIRRDFVEHAWLVAVTYYSRVIEWLHVDRHFGAVRCERAYRGLRKRYDDYIDHYLMCSKAGDEYIQQMRDHARDTLDAIGIQIQHSYFQEGKIHNAKE